jgi:hypothetical protein
LGAPELDGRLALAPQVEEQLDEPPALALRDGELLDRLAVSVLRGEELRDPTPAAERPRPQKKVPDESPDRATEGCIDRRSTPVQPPEMPLRHRWWGRQLSCSPS